MTKKKVKDEFGLKADRLETIKTVAQKKAYKAPEVCSLDSKIELKDLRAERDALATRVMELEHVRFQSSEMKSFHAPEALDLAVKLDEERKLSFSYESFIRECLRTGGFNSSVATELLKR